LAEPRRPSASRLNPFSVPRVPARVAKAESKLAFETTVRVKGKVVETVMCDCEEEGHVGIRVARHARGGDWSYSKEDRDSYYDIVAYSKDGAYATLRPGDWVEANVTIHGRLARVPTGELDLAFEAIREWEPQPLSHLALPPEADTADLRAFQWQLALLAVFLHELHHLVSPEEPEVAVRNQSQKFYADTLSHFVAEQFGVEYGLRHSAE